MISEYFSWCEGGRRSGIDFGDRVLGSASKEEEEEETIVEIRTNGKNEVYIYIYIYWEVFDILLVVKE